jgi:hypothetical protein
MQYQYKQHGYSPIAKIGISFLCVTFAGKVMPFFAIGRMKSVAGDI